MRCRPTRLPGRVGSRHFEANICNFEKIFDRCVVPGVSILGGVLRGLRFPGKSKLPQTAFIMSAKFKKSIMTLAVFAMALMQIFGIQAGFFCECTGAKSAESTCVAEECHPEHDSSGLVEKKAALLVCCGSAEAGTSPTDQAPEDQPQHPHKEIREPLLITGLPPVLHPPVPIFFDLPPALQLPDFAVLTVCLPGKISPEPPEYGSPPMPQMVAQTIVMLI